MDHEKTPSFLTTFKNIPLEFNNTVSALYYYIKLYFDNFEKTQFLWQCI